MPFITTPDGAEIFYKDWGQGQPVVLSHGWPLNSDSWESQQLHLASNGFRTTAAATAARLRPGAATRWTPTATTWPP
jgi:pimeloyl-ACP methyl ester carboxylesterase